MDNSQIHRLMTQSGCGGTLTPAVRRFAQACEALGVAAERERLRVLVEAVRTANGLAEDGGTFRLLTLGQERAWMALLSGLEGPNV